MNKKGNYYKSKKAYSFPVGNIPWNKGKKASEEHRKKISESLKKAYREGRKKVSEKFTHKGIKHNEETKKKMRDKKLGSKQNQEIIEKRVKAVKRFWKKKENKEKLLMRNKKISKAEKGKKIKLSSYEFRIGKTFEELYGKERGKEIKNKIKEARKYQVTPIKDTKIEFKIQNFLKELNIEFFTHQYMKIKHGYQCDILIPSMKMVIECDGDYWHKYPVGNEIDHIRTKELLNKGFKVLRLWESEIDAMNLNDFKEILNEQ